MRGLQDDTGGIITGWLLQMILFIGVFGLIVYEVASIGVTAVGLDDTSRDVARAAALNYRETQDLAEATEAAQQRAQALDVQITEGPTIDEGDVVLTVAKAAPTLVVDQIGFLEDYATPSVTGRAAWDER